MNTKLLWPIAAVAVALALVCRTEPPTVAPLADVPAAASPSAIGMTAPRAEVPAPAPDVPATRAEASAPPAPAGAAIAARFANGYRGRLLLPDRTPAAGLPVELLGFDPTHLLLDGLGNGDWSVAPPQLLQQRTASDRDGRFHFDRVTPGVALVLSAAAGTAHAFATRIEHAPDTGKVVDLGDLVLPAKTTLRGRLVDEHGTPVASADLVALPDDVTELLSLQDLPRGFRADLLTPDALLARVLGPTLQVFEVRPFAALAAALQLPTARSADDGTFAIVGVDLPSTLVVRNVARPTLRERIRGAASGERDLGDVALPAKRWLRGRLIGRDGGPVVDADIQTGPATPGAPLHVLAPAGRTGGDGTFAAAAESSGPWFCAVRDRVHGRWLASGPYAGDEVAEIRWPATADLDLRCAEATPATPVDVALLPGDVRGTALALGALAPAAAVRLHDGAAWHVADLPLGTYTLVAAAPGRARLRELLVHDRAAVRAFQLAAAATIHVTVVDVQGAPIAGARLTAVPEAPPDWQRRPAADPRDLSAEPSLPSAVAASDDDGRAELAGIPDGTPLTIRAQHPGYAGAAARITTPAASVVIELHDAGVIEGAVLDHGQPLARGVGIDVRCVDAHQELRLAPRVARTDAQGRFRIAGLGEGDYEVSLTMDFDRPRQSTTLAALGGLLRDRPVAGARPTRRVQVRAGAVATALLELGLQFAAPDQPRLDVHGHVTINGAPAAGRRVNLWQNDCYRTSPGPGRFLPASTVVGTDGEYRFVGIRTPLQTRTLRLILRSLDDTVTLANVERTIDPTAGEAAIDLAIDAGELVGDVVDQDGAPKTAQVGVAGAMLESGPDGRFRARELALGSYDVQVFSKGGVANYRNRAVVAGVNQWRLVAYEFVRVAGTVDLRRVTTPAGRALTVVMEVHSQPVVNYRPMAVVDKTTGRFEIGGEPVMADEYDFYLHCDGQWYRHPEPIFVLPGKALDLVLTPVPAAAPEGNGPGVFRPAPPLRDGEPVRPAGGGIRTTGAGEARPLRGR